MEPGGVSRKISITGFSGFLKGSSVELDLSKRIILIIGKNNSGKSSISKAFRDLFAGDSKTAPTLKLSVVVSESMVKRYFSSGQYFIGSPAKTYFDWGKQAFLNKTIPASITAGDSISFDYPKELEKLHPELKRIAKLMIEGAIKQWKPTHYGDNFFVLSAERDVLSEALTSSQTIDEKGNGLTSILAEYATSKEHANDNLIEETLECFNEILGGTLVFDRLEPRFDSNGKYEIMLREKGREILPLSSLGSGLKTLLLVIVGMLLYPDRNFCFDELENSLHPALQRRLFQFIYDKAVEADRHVIITTHSAIPLNQFYGQDDVQIIRVWKSDGICRAETVCSNLAMRNCIDDLGNKASDLLQSNGIIWVEGPSDRIYIEKWLQLAGCNYREGVHYCYGYTGGKNLAQYDVDKPDLDKINMLFLNKNAFIVMDRDRDDEAAEINETKKRIIEEAKEQNTKVWLTKGREIENYLSSEAICSALDLAELPIEWTAFSKATDLIQQLGKTKVELARALTSKMDEASLDYLDLRDRIQSLMGVVDGWNNGLAN